MEIDSEVPDKLPIQNTDPVEQVKKRRPKRERKPRRKFFHLELKRLSKLTGFLQFLAFPFTLCPFKTRFSLKVTRKGF